jgi:hypothetical protein
VYRPSTLGSGAFAPEGPPTDADGPIPISDGELAWVESKLGARLPPSYRAFLRRGRPLRLGSCRFYGLRVTDPAEDLMLANRFAGAARTLGFVAVGETADGRYHFCLDTAAAGPDGESPVVVCGPETPARRVAAGFADFWQGLRQAFFPPRPAGEAGRAAAAPPTEGAAP